MISVVVPIHNEEPERLGVTVHRLTAAIDGGPILHTGIVPYERGDDEDTLFAKGIRIGSCLLVEAVREVAEGRAVEQPQPAGVGREFRFVDRTMAAERRAARVLRRGLAAPPGGA